MWLRFGRFGPYVERGEGEGRARASLPKDWTPESVDLEKARALLALPRELGRDPGSGEPVVAGIGRYGPYVQRGDRYLRLSGSNEVFTIDLDEALRRLAEAEAGGKVRRTSTVLRELGPHPEDGKPVRVMKGRFGPYVAHGRTFASLPKDADPESVDLAAAVELLAARAAGGRKKSGAKAKAGATKGTRKAASYTITRKTSARRTSAVAKGGGSAKAAAKTTIRRRAKGA
ncbi:DNA topoisomerase 1 [bacterium HR39]|nr:DNA topoisomerase 1 [bacterium HR39]